MTHAQTWSPDSDDRPRFRGSRLWLLRLLFARFCCFSRHVVPVLIVFKVRVRSSVGLAFPAARSLRPRRGRCVHGAGSQHPRRWPLAKLPLERRQPGIHGLARGDVAELSPDHVAAERRERQGTTVAPKATARRNAQRSVRKIIARRAAPSGSVNRREQGSKALGRRWQLWLAGDGRLRQGTR